jgi:hypothetical protein
VPKDALRASESFLLDTQRLPRQPEPADADEDASREQQIIEDALAGSRGRVSLPP